MVAEMLRYSFCLRLIGDEAGVMGRGQLGDGAGGNFVLTFGTYDSWCPYPEGVFFQGFR
jgi:hypothetical protein